MAELHPLVLLAQRLAEGRRQHSSNAAFGQWVKENGFDRLTHRDRAALIRIAQLDPQEASDHISRSSHTTPELLWYRVLSRLAVRKTALVPVRKTEPEPESEVELVKRIERFLDWLADGETDAVVGEWFDENVLAVAGAIDYATRDPARIWAAWLEEQELFDLDDDNRKVLMTLISDRGVWEAVVMRKMAR